MRILTNHPGQKESPTWASVTTRLPPEEGGSLTALGNAIRLYLKAIRGQYDCIVLGAGTSDGIFALLKAILPFNIPPLIQIDCLWHTPKGRMGRALRTTYMKIYGRAVDSYIVWARREIDAYSREFGLPREKFHFIPYHNTMHGFDDVPHDGGYIFSGGNYDRDYRTLLEAVDGIEVPVRIGCTRKEQFTGLQIPHNVDIRGYSHTEYLKVMGGCKINIVAMKGGLLHSGGQQTFINSMTMGKPTIVTDPDGGRDYIEDGVDGFLVPPADPRALREKIIFLLKHPEIAWEIGKKAKERGVSLTTEKHFQSIVRFIEYRKLTSPEKDA